jgi:hypothetical protein
MQNTHAHQNGEARGPVKRAGWFNYYVLKSALVGPNKSDYEKIRARLIALFGYDTFRDLQSAIFADLFAADRFTDECAK